MNPHILCGCHGVRCRGALCVTHAVPDNDYASFIVGLLVEYYGFRSECTEGLIVYSVENSSICPPSRFPTLQKVALNLSRYDGSLLTRTVRPPNFWPTAIPCSPMTMTIPPTPSLPNLRVLMAIPDQNEASRLLYRTQTC